MKVQGSIRPRLSAVLLAALLATPLVSSAHAADAATPADLWRQFSHYTLIGRTDMAVKAADGLLADGVDHNALLDGIESTATRYHEVERIMEQAMKTKGLEESGKKLFVKIQNARMTRAKEPARILEDIGRLGDGARAYANAIDRLRASGPYAVPYYIKTLQDQSKARLHTHVLEAMAEIGEPVVYPTAIAISHLDFGTAERLSDVLARIGSPAAMPTLKMLSEDTTIRETSRKVFASSFNEINAKCNLGGSTDTADLFVRLGEGYYLAGTRGELPSCAVVMNEEGPFWSWNKTLGLTSVEIPKKIVADRMAMQAAESALTVNNNQARALTLHLAANLRRENSLGGTLKDGSYHARPPEANILLAGPTQQQNVLARALGDHDVPLALDAIRALSETMDDYHFEAVRTPLLDTLLYSDIRVRINGALALANANPKAAFPGSIAVVPTLGQAICVTEQPSAMIVAEPAQVAAISDHLVAAGFRAALGGNNLEQARAVYYPVQSAVDMIVYSGSLEGFKAMMAEMHNDGLLMGLPILAIVDDEVGAGIRVNFPRESAQITSVSPSVLGKDGNLASTAQDAIKRVRGDGLSPDLAKGLAVQATVQLREIAIANLAGSKVYQATDARHQLITALSDTRDEVAQGAGRVLECFNDADSQEAMLKAALAGSGATQESIFNSLAKSFEAFGKKITPESEESLVKFVLEHPQQEHIGAARAQGAMNCEAKQAVNAILTPIE